MSSNLPKLFRVIRAVPIMLPIIPNSDGQCKLKLIERDERRPINLGKKIHFLYVCKAIILEPLI